MVEYIKCTRDEAALRQTLHHQMPKMLTTIVPLLLATATTISAHGYVSTVIADGVTYTGGNPNNIYANPKPTIPFWFASNLDNGFVPTSSYSGPDIICPSSG